MYKKISLFIIMCTVLVLSAFIPRSYAYQQPLALIQKVEGNIPYYLSEEDNRIYVCIELTQSWLSNQMYDSGMNFGISRIITLYDTFVISNDKGVILKSFTDFDYIEIDSLDFYYTGNVIFKSNQETFSIDTNACNVFYAYIVKDVTYDPAGEDIIFIADIDDEKPISEFNQFFAGWDNYDGVLDIEVLEDNYSSNMTKLGLYDVTLMITDSSYNKTYLTYQIQVKDLKAPTVIPQSSIKISYTNRFDVGEFIQGLEISDNVSLRENIHIDVIQNEYKDNEEKLGEYQISFSIKDESENETIYTQKVIVIDDVAPVVTGTNHYEKQVEEYLSVASIIGNLNISDVYTSKPSVSVILDEYSDHMHEIGSYKVELSISDSAKNKTFFTITIDVVDQIPPAFYLNLGLIETTQLVVLTQNELREILSKKIPIQYDRFDIVMDDYNNHQEEPGVYQVRVHVYSEDVMHNFQLMIRVNEETLTVTPEPTFDPTWIYVSGGVIILILGIGVYYFIRRRSLKRTN
jgi:hypothetical protein